MVKPYSQVWIYSYYDPAVFSGGEEGLKRVGKVLRENSKLYRHDMLRPAITTT